VIFLIFVAAFVTLACVVLPLATVAFFAVVRRRARPAPPPESAKRRTVVT
jgi:hypothetical protein